MSTKNKPPAKPQEKAAAAKPGWAHASAVIDDGAVLGDGTKVWHFSHVMGGARLGRNCVLGQNVFIAATVAMGDGCKIQNNVSLYDGVVLEDAVFVGPSAVFTNVVNPRANIVRKDEYRPTVVEQGATIGANATIVCGNRIGHHALIAAGAVVTREVPAHALMMGVPARRTGWVCACGITLPLAKAGKTSCRACKTTYQVKGRGDEQRLLPVG